MAAVEAVVKEHLGQMASGGPAGQAKAPSRDWRNYEQESLLLPIGFVINADPRSASWLASRSQAYKLRFAAMVDKVATDEELMRCVLTPPGR